MRSPHAGARAPPCRYPSGLRSASEPRIHRRRRGHDFLENYHRALAPALEGCVDLVVHGGDVFHRPDVPHSLVYQAFEPLTRVADLGIPVFVVPGSHERSRIPHVRFASHPGIRIFDRPRTFRVDVGGCRVALSGFPYTRKVRDAFPSLLADTGWRDEEADVALLCVHHCFAGATVGPVDYTFRQAPDVVQARDIPAGFAAVLTGHIHRHHVLTRDVAGRPLAAPVLYPGSVERTAFAEMTEAKGYMVLDLEAHDPGSGGRLVSWDFEALPARPMVVRKFSAQGMGPAALAAAVETAVRRAPAHAVLRLRIRGHVPASARTTLSAARLWAIAPAEMNVEVVLDGKRGRERHVPPTRLRSRVGAP